MFGLLRYLYGPGRRNEHTDPHLVAVWDDPTALEPGRRDGRVKPRRWHACSTSRCTRRPVRWTRSRSDSAPYAPRRRTGGSPTPNGPRWPVTSPHAPDSPARQMTAAVAGWRCATPRITSTPPRSQYFKQPPGRWGQRSQGHRPVQFALGQRLAGGGTANAGAVDDHRLRRRRRDRRDCRPDGCREGSIVAVGAVALVTIVFTHRQTACCASGPVRQASGPPHSRLVLNGELRRGELRPCGLTDNDPFAELRLRGVFDLRELRYVLYETKVASAWCAGRRGTGAHSCPPGSRWQPDDGTALKLADRCDL